MTTVTHTINTPLLNTTMAFIAANPHRLDLDHWWHIAADGPRGCVAGWAGYFSGHTFAQDYTTCHRYHKHPLMSVDAIAQLELHLTDTEADKLFTCLSRREMWRIVKKLTRGEITKKTMQRDRSPYAQLPRKLLAPSARRCTRTAAVCQDVTYPLAKTELVGPHVVCRHGQRGVGLR